MIKEIDQYGVQLAASLARHSVMFDEFVTVILLTSTFKMGPMAFCLWVLWFAEQNRESRRLHAIKAVMAGGMALLISRVIQNLSPERTRPIHSGNPDYVRPYGMDEDVLRDWSSFPSDNAALSVALAAGIFAASRPMGIFCLIWCFTIVSIPRIYGGLHYVSDILGGIVIGFVCYGICALLQKPSKKLLEFAEALESRNRPVFYALLFLFSFQLVSMFGDVRAVGRLIMGTLD